MTLSTL